MKRKKMIRYVILLVFILSIIESCKDSSKNDSDEIETISNTLLEHNSYLVDDLTISNIVTPKRYGNNYKLYFIFKKQLIKIIKGVDTLTKCKNYQIDSKMNDRFKELWSSVDSIYDPRIDKMIINEKDTITQKTNLEQYINPLKIKIEHCSSKTDLRIIKLYLGLIDSEILEFLYKKAKQNTIPVNLIKPITFPNGKNIDCYISSIDTMHYPIILIGTFDSLKRGDGYVFYKPKQIIDTVFFNKEKAIINQDQLKVNEAILYYPLPDGSRMNYKIK